MGIHNRPYWREGSDANEASPLSVGLPPIGRVVKYLVIINVAVYVVQMVLERRASTAGWMSNWFGASAWGWWQIWRYITFQFLHSPDDFWHIVMNMLGLYLLGSPLEQRWGGRKFLWFYLGCGAVAGITYVAVSAAVGGLTEQVPIVGASGGVFAILLACAVLFPQFRLIFLFFPVAIRLAALIIFGGMVLLVLKTVLAGQYNQPQFWSQVCHLGGAGAAAVYIWLLPRVSDFQLRRAFSRGTAPGSGRWKRRMARMAAEQAEIDRILEKIHEQGVASLTRQEQKKLRDATRRQKAMERDAYR